MPKNETTPEKVCSNCGKWVFYDNGLVTFHCSCNSGWTYKDDSENERTKTTKRCRTFSPYCGNCVDEQKKQFNEVMRHIKRHFPVSVKIINRQMHMVRSHAEN